MSVRKNDEERTSQYSLSVFCISSSVIKESDVYNTEYYFSKNVCAETKFTPVKSSAVVSCLTGQAKIIQMRQLYRGGLHTADVVDTTNL